MKLSRDDQTQFAKEILGIIDAHKGDTDVLGHLHTLTSLLIDWAAGGNDDIAVYLGEHIGELEDIANGSEDTGWADEFKKKLDVEMNIRGETMHSNSRAMDLSRDDQIKFAKGILALLECCDISPEILGHLRNLESLLVTWVGEDNGVAVGLSEYIGALNDIANGSEDDGWADEFKKALYYDIGYENRLEK